MQMMRVLYPKCPRSSIGTFEQRQTLASDWNELVRAGCRVTLRQFAARHGLRYETWRREYLRGATGAAVPDPKDRRRRKYAEYDPFKAQDVINENNANKGARMLVTNQMAFLFKRHVLEERLFGIILLAAGQGGNIRG